MGRQKFSLKKYEKDRQKCYKMSKSGINLGQLSATEDMIISQRTKSLSELYHGSPESEELYFDAENCEQRDALGLCILPIKDRNMNKCRLCLSNV